MDKAYRPHAAGSQPKLDSPAYGSTARRHPLHAPVRIGHTITETSGPSFAPDRFPPLADLASENGHAGGHPQGHHRARINGLLLA